MGRVPFQLTGTNVFHVKAADERFTAATLRCRQNLKLGIFTSSFGKLRQRNVLKCVPHSYFSSFNQSYRCGTLWTGHIMLITYGIMPYSKPNSSPSFGLRNKNMTKLPDKIIGFLVKGENCSSWRKARLKAEQSRAEQSRAEQSRKPKKSTKDV